MLSPNAFNSTPLRNAGLREASKTPPCTEYTGGKCGKGDAHHKLSPEYNPGNEQYVTPDRQTETLPSPPDYSAQTLDTELISAILIGNEEDKEQHLAYERYQNLRDKEFDEIVEAVKVVSLQEL